jgi:hypothetical protein
MGTKRQSALIQLRIEALDTLFENGVFQMQMEVTKSQGEQVMRVIVHPRLPHFSSPNHHFLYSSRSA